MLGCAHCQRRHGYDTDHWWPGRVPAGGAVLSISVVTSGRRLHSLISGRPVRCQVYWEVCRSPPGAKHLHRERAGDDRLRTGSGPTTAAVHCVRVSIVTDHGAPMIFHCSVTVKDRLYKKNYREMKIHPAPKFREQMVSGVEVTNFCLFVIFVCAFNCFR